MCVLLPARFIRSVASVILSPFRWMAASPSTGTPTSGFLAPVLEGADCHSSSPTAVSLLGIPVELRLQIYEKLLLYHETIILRVDYMDDDSNEESPQVLWFRPIGHGLHPVILRVSKQIFYEASPILYSNRFRLPVRFFTQGRIAGCPLVPPFLTMIETQAPLVRHVCINFPVYGTAQMREERLKKMIKTLASKCSWLRTLEVRILWGKGKWVLNPTPPDLTNARNRCGVITRKPARLSSLRTITVNFLVLDADTPDQWLEVLDMFPDCDSVRDRDDQDQGVCLQGWSTTVSTLSLDDREVCYKFWRRRPYSRPFNIHSGMERWYLSRLYHWGPARHEQVAERFAGDQNDIIDIVLRATGLKTSSPSQPYR